MPIDAAAIEVAVVEAHIVLVATVKRVVGGTPGLFPFALVEVFSVLIVVADDREQPHARGTERLADLRLQRCVEAAIVLHVVAHAQSVDGHVGGQSFQSLTHVGHRLLGEAGHIGDLHWIVVRAGIVRTIGVGHLRVAEDEHGIAVLLARGQRFQPEVIDRVGRRDTLIDACRVVLVAVRGHLGPVGNGVVDVVRGGAATQRVVARRVGLHALDAVADCHRGYWRAVGAPQRALYHR